MMKLDKDSIYKLSEAEVKEDYLVKGFFPQLTRVDRNLRE